MRTAAQVLEVLDSAHLIEPVADGEGWYRGKCSCGWLSFAEMTWEDAAALTCEAEAEHARGVERLRQWNERMGR